MATFHFHAAVVSRGKGQSAIAKAAYNAREALRDERTGELKDYSHRDGVLFTGIFPPENAPEWVRDRAALWNAVERKEDGSTRPAQAQLARSLDLALPHELTDEQRRRLLTDFVREQFQRRGMVADVAIHAPDLKGDARNHHAHILLTMRELGPEGFGKKVRDWNDRGEVERWREAWERTTNRYLEHHGHEDRVDRRTLVAQGIDREPTTHRGPHIDAMERRGIATERATRVPELGKDAAAIRMAYSLSDSGPAFAAALREQGFRLACVTMSDTLQHQQSRADHLAAGKTPPRWLEVGELVVVDRRGGFHRLDERTTGDRPQEVQKYLAAVDRADVPGVYDARADQARQDRPSHVEAKRGTEQENAARLDDLRALHSDIIQEQRHVRQLLRDTELTPTARAELREIATTLREFHSDTRQEIRALEREQPREERPAVSMEREESAAAITGAVLGKAAQMLDYAGERFEGAVDGLADMFGASAPTPEVIAARQEAKEHAAEQRKIDWERFGKDAAYAEQVQRQQEADDAAERQRQYYDRQKRGDRER